MRRLLAVCLAVWVVAGCVDRNAALTQPLPSAAASTGATTAPAVETDHDDRSNLVRQSPDASARTALGFANAPSPDPRAVGILSPAVRTVASPIAIAPLPTHRATTADLDTVRTSVGEWSKNLIGMLDRRRHPQPGVDPELDLRNMFSEPRAAQVVVKTLATGTVTGQPALALVDWSLNGGLMRAWGSPAFLDVTVRAHDHGPTDDVDLTWRMRVQPVGFWYRVIDIFDPTSSAWLVGEAPRYSAVELNTELRLAAQAYLRSESYSPVWPVNGTVGGADTQFWRVRNEAITVLNRRVASGALTERYFENVSASIERFEPAWFGGDGVVTVTLRGRLIETVAGGRQATSDFTQRLKFLRTIDLWTAVDAQEDDGGWDSGGNLALADVARPHG